jgi:hypothetical protein
MKESCAGATWEAEVLETEAVVFGRLLILVAVLKDLVPDGERILLVLPALFP